MPRSVCMPDCADRTATCHSTCKKYLDWHKKNNERNLERFKQQDAAAYTVAQVIKTKTTGGCKGLKKLRPKRDGKCER